MALTIGKLARRAGVNVETIRYYERIGLILQPIKPIGGFRHYDDAILERVQFIKKAQALGFRLEEVKYLLELARGRCSDIQQIAESKLDDVRSKIADLKRLETVLGGLVKQCRANADEADCPIVESLLPEKTL